MSNWLSRLADRFGALLHPATGPWTATADWVDVDADVRRLRDDLAAVRARFSDHR